MNGERQQNVAVTMLKHDFAQNAISVHLKKEIGNH